MSDPVLTNQAEEALEEAYDTSDKEQVNKARKKAARKRADRLKYVQASMQFPEGRAWFYDYLIFTKVFDSIFNNDPYRTAFDLGQRNIGLVLLGDIQTAAPKEYVIMVQENKRSRE